MTSGQLVPFLPALAIAIALALTASLCLKHGLRPDFPTVCGSFLNVHLLTPVPGFEHDPRPTSCPA